MLSSEAECEADARSTNTILNNDYRLLCCAIPDLPISIHGLGTSYEP